MKGKYYKVKLVYRFRFKKKVDYYSMFNTDEFISYLKSILSNGQIKILRLEIWQDEA